MSESGWSHVYIVRGSRTVCGREEVHGNGVQCPLEGCGGVLTAVSGVGVERNVVRCARRSTGEERCAQRTHQDGIVINVMLQLRSQRLLAGETPPRLSHGRPKSTKGSITSHAC